MSKEQDIYSCPYCGHYPIVRIHKEGNIICNNCNEPLLHDVDSWSSDRYIVCPNPKCRNEIKNPKHGDICPRPDCGYEIL